MPTIDLQGNSLVELNVGKPAKPLPLQASVEPVQGYWTGKADWGQGYKGGFPAAEGVQIQLGRVPNMPGPPRARSILLGRRNAFISIPSGGINSAIRAKIIYGVGGVTNQFYCDWVNGTAVSVVASSLQVVAESFRPEPTNPTYSTTGQPNLDISAVLGCEAASQGNATYTVEENQGSGDSDVINIPQFANRVSILTTAAAGAAHSVDFYCTFSSFTLSSDRIRATNGAWIPLPGDCRILIPSAVATGVAWCFTFGLAV